MSWSIPLYIALTVALLTEARRLARRKAFKEIAIFLSLWTIAFTLVVADQLGVAWLRPLNWIKVIVQPLNKLLS